MRRPGPQEKLRPEFDPGAPEDGIGPGKHQMKRTASALWPSAWRCEPFLERTFVAFAQDFPDQYTLTKAGTTVEPREVT